MRLPRVPQIWTPDYQQRVNAELERSDADCRKKGQDIEMAQGDGVRKERLIMTSPGGSRWEITVSDAGVLSASPV